VKVVNLNWNRVVSLTGICNRVLGSSPIGITKKKKSSAPAGGFFCFIGLCQLEREQLIDQAEMMGLYKKLPEEKDARIQLLETLINSSTTDPAKGKK
jgi:hypothetical protein